MQLMEVLGTKGMPMTSSAVIFQITRLHEYRIAETMIPVFAAFTADHTATIFHTLQRISSRSDFTRHKANFIAPKKERHPFGEIVNTL